MASFQYFRIKPTFLSTYSMCSCSRTDKTQCEADKCHLGMWPHSYLFLFCFIIIFSSAISVNRVTLLVFSERFICSVELGSDDARYLTFSTNEPPLFSFITSHVDRLNIRPKREKINRNSTFIYLANLTKIPRSLRGARAGLSRGRSSFLYED